MILQKIAAESQRKLGLAHNRVAETSHHREREPREIS
jgi:hypothetical protein